VHGRVVNEPLDRAARERELDAVTELHCVNLSPENRFEASPLGGNSKGTFAPNADLSGPSFGLMASELSVFARLRLASPCHFQFCCGTYCGDVPPVRRFSRRSARALRPRTDDPGGGRAIEAPHTAGHDRYSAAIKAKPWGHRKGAPSSIERPDARTGELDRVLRAFIGLTLH